MSLLNPPQCQPFFNRVNITQQSNPVTRGEDWTLAAQLASTGNFTSANWVTTGKVTEALIHCTVIQLGAAIGGFPSLIRSQCALPVLFDNGDMMLWHGVETINISWYPPRGGSQMPFAIEGGYGEWVGASGQGVINCEFFDPPTCTAEGAVCKGDKGPEISKLLNGGSKAGKLLN